MASSRLNIGSQTKQFMGINIRHTKQYFQLFCTLIKDLAVAYVFLNFLNLMVDS